MLTVAELSKQYTAQRGRAIQAASRVSFQVPGGQFFTLLGPSGCGKTTILRCIAGLERPDAGEIRIAERVIYSARRNVFVRPNRRGFGMVFQSYAIWPHMNVFQNVAFPLQVSPERHSRGEIQRRVGEALQAVDLAGLEERSATQLSGGQQQRLALARALVIQPSLLLLDEPLSNLDAKLRERMQLELKRLQRQLQITTVYVTHDQSEALALSHQIAVMEQGRIVQIGTPREIYQQPRNRFVADFVGSTNLVPGTIRERLPDPVKGDCYRVLTPLGSMTVRSPDAGQPGDPVLIAIRPEDIGLHRERSQQTNSWPARVDTVAFLGETLSLRLQAGDTTLYARVHPSWVEPEQGRLFIQIDPDRCLLIRE